MKNQKEIYRALLDGETLVNDEILIKFKDGFLYNVQAGCKDNWQFDYPKCWSIYKEPKWYEDIPKDGVLCWVWEDGEKGIGIIVEYYSTLNDNFITFDDREFEVAKPLTKQEIQVFMDNAPKE